MNNLLVNQVGPLSYFKLLAILGDYVGLLSLDYWWDHIKVWGLWLVHLVPWVLPYLLNIYSFIWVCNKNLSYHVLGFFGEEIWKIVFSVEDLLV